ncbi:MAG: alginate export family protein [Methylococcales bacterium]|nr:alginate export family protein [Methylococcales bacterium]
MQKCHSRSPLLILFPHVLILLSVFSSGAIAASFSTEIIDSLKGNWGQFKLNANWRYANVDQEGKEVAKGDPIRLRFGYLSPKIFEFQAFAEFEGNTPVFEYQYDSKRNGKTQFPVVPDPQVAELNQAWLSYTGLPDTVVKGGRQRITCDNVRWIGAIPWRQMEQTYDAVSLVNKSIPNTELHGAFIWNVLDVFSHRISMTTPFLNLSLSFPKIGKLITYAYLLDYKIPDTKSTQSYGVRFDGKRKVMGNLEALYTAEFAYQRDYKDNPNRYNAYYLHFIGGFQIPQLPWNGVTDFTAKIGWEQLGSDNGVGLQTPLGTNHAFNGWADKFLTTPSQGIHDMYGTLSTQVHGIKLMAVYHQYDSAIGNIDYGHEIDALAVKKFAGHYTVMFKYANYSAQNHATDTQKIWMSVGVDF